MSQISLELIGLSEVDINLNRDDGYNPLGLAMESRSSEVVEALFNRDAKFSL